MSNQLVQYTLEDKKEIVAHAMASNFFSAFKNKSQALIITLAAESMGMSPVWGLQNMFVINNKPGVGAEGLLGLCFKNIPGFGIEYKQHDENGCTIEVIRQNSKPATFSFTMDDARRAGLTGKDVWRKYPKDMLRSRCISQMCRAYCSDAVQGNAYTEEEVTSFTEERDITPAKTEAPSVEPTAEPSMAESKLQDDSTTQAKQTPKTVPNFATGGKDMVISDDEGGNYVIPSGKNKGKSLNELGYNKVKHLVDFFTDNGNKVARGWCGAVVKNFSLMKPPGEPINTPPSKEVPSLNTEEEIPF